MGKIWKELGEGKAQIGGVEMFKQKYKFAGLMRKSTASSFYFA